MKSNLIQDLLGVDCKVNRIAYEQQRSDTVLVFKLNGRPPEGTILTRDELEKIGYSFGIIRKNVKYVE